MKMIAACGVSDEPRQNALWQMVKFTLFSISAGIIQVGSFASMELFIQGYRIPYRISQCLSIL